MEECHFVQFVPASLCSRGQLTILKIKRDRHWWSKYESEFIGFTKVLQSQFHSAEPTEPIKRQKLDTPVAVVPAAIAPTEPSSHVSQFRIAGEEVTKATTEKPSPETSLCQTSSPGLYDFWVDPSIQVSRDFLQMLESDEPDQQGHPDAFDLAQEEFSLVQCVLGERPPSVFAPVSAAPVDEPTCSKALTHDKTQGMLSSPSKADGSLCKKSDTSATLSPVRQHGDHTNEASDEGQSQGLQIEIKPYCHLSSDGMSCRQSVQLDTSSFTLPEKS